RGIGIGDDTDAIWHAHDLPHAFHFARFPVVDAERRLAVDRRAQYGAIQHAQHPYVDAVFGLSAHFVRHLDARNVLADEAKLARPLELLARELRRAGRDHGELRDLAVGELAPRRLVHDGIRLGAELAGRHLPFERRALDHRSEEHTSELQSRGHLVCRLLLEKKKKLSTLYSTLPPTTHSAPNQTASPIINS